MLEELPNKLTVIISTIVIPLLGIIVYKKRNRFKSKSFPVDNSKIEEIIKKVDRLEDAIIKNHMELDEAKLDIAYLKGRDSKRG